jgi:hypothetical protein
MRKGCLADDAEGEILSAEDPFLREEERSARDDAKSLVVLVFRDFARGVTISALHLFNDS